YYSQMGIKGFKVDFFDRDDQLSVERVYRIAQKCADYKLVLDLHGMYKPTGLNRTFPNILNFEGVFGLEELKWNSTADMVKYDVTFPFIRVFAGPVDYTQGAMSNAVKADFRAVYSNPMSQGTRAHQLGTYIVFDSPLVTLCDSPTAYMKEKDCTDYITSIPTVFDFTKILQGEIGEFIVTLRRSDSLAVGHWYVGGLNNWTSRKVTIDFSFLGDSDKRYVADIIRDGINSSKEGCDYIRVLHSITGQSKLDIEMAPGGGFAISVRPLILPCK
ncbi:MAG: glycoside hydrolase family 97 catalytic domain-containing protein, partial [Clostridia bacterium]|nr:glycoside hydrolase family 97 catalytic domain-containing protein [Clostridia bacterium]